MRRRPRQYAVLVMTAMAVAALAATAWPDTHYVAPPDTPGVTSTPPYTSWSTAATNIQDAISAAVASDTVLVTNGVYDSGGTTNYPAASTLTNRVTVNKALILRSVNGPAVTTIKGGWDPDTNGPAAVRGVYLTANSQLIGFTVTNCATKTSTYWQYGQAYGGGVYCADNTAIISNCVIAENACGISGAGAYYGTYYNCTLSENNASVASGGGAQYGVFNTCTLRDNIAAYWGGGVADATLTNCVISGNFTSSSPGGGVHQSTCYNCTISGNSTTGGEGNGSGGGASGSTLYNCLIVSNTALGNGGVGDTIWGPSTLYNCLIANNSGTNTDSSLYGGGGVCSKGMGVALYNCTIAGNDAATTNGGGVWIKSTGTGTFVNCIIYNNSAAGGTNNNYFIAGAASFTNCDTTPIPEAGENNITADPLFRDLSGNDFRLAQGSPCINAGLNQDWMENAADLDGKPRIDRLSGKVDVGCYEYIPRGMLFTAY